MIELLNVTALVAAYRWARQCIGLPRVPPGWRSVGRYCYTPEIYRRRRSMESFRESRERRKAREERLAAANKEVLDRVAETTAGFPLPLRRRAREMCHAYQGALILVGALLGMVVALWFNQVEALFYEAKSGGDPASVLLSHRVEVGMAVLVGTLLVAFVFWVLPKVVGAASRRIGLDDAETDGLELQPEETSSQEPI